MANIDVITYIDMYICIQKRERERESKYIYIYIYIGSM